MHLDSLGLSASRLIAGFGGGLVHAFVFKQTTPWTVASSVMTGTLTANFLTAPALHYAPAWVGDGAVAFLVGLSAMAICQGAVAAVRMRIRVAEDPDGKS